jgi:hypothetical protein
MPATNAGISISVTYRVGAIALRTGISSAEDPWGWSCGFYPGSYPRECTDGTAATFDEAAPTSKLRGEYSCRIGPRPISKGGPGATERNPVDASYP